MARAYFPAVIEASREGYSVFFPDLGMHSAGDTAQEAALNAEKGLRSHMELMVEEGFNVPTPSELDAIRVDPDVKEVARILVPVDLPSTKVLRLNVTLPEDLVRRIDAASKNRSGFLAKAAELVLERDQRSVKRKRRRERHRTIPAKRRRSA